MGDEGRSSGAFTFFAFLLGTLTGACLGLLLAPAAGHETRKWIRDTSVATKNRAEDFAQNTVQTGSEAVHKYVNLGKEQIHDTAQNLRAAVEAGKKAYGDKREEIDSDLSHSGEETAPDDGDDAA
ncbi:MAG: YtxH domain-containing protein [Candidatus Poribacteria bacterium]|nr:YtxH domain-containing protein [Candidatus Poribacteria bacterium]MDE0504869.1 YtxH domain-containing protein [Candidatus Poribacteria bacterium]